MKTKKYIAFMACAVVLSACMFHERQMVQPTLPDDPVGVKQDIFLNSIHIGVPSRNGTPIQVVLTVPNACYRFMGGSVYSRGSSIVIDTVVSEGFQIGRGCGGKSVIMNVFHYPFAMRGGRDYSITVVVNGRTLGTLNAYPPGGYRLR